MYGVKDKVYNKLSRFFSDSQTSDEPVDHESEVRSHAKDGKSQSSMLSLILPSASWFRSNARTNDLKSSRSDSFKWRSKSFSLKDKPVERSTESKNEYETRENIRSYEECGETLDRHLEYTEPGSGRSTASSDVFEDAITPHSFEKSMPSLVDESIFISPDLYHFFEASLPNIVKGCQYVLLYSTARHGISLHTLLRKSADLSGPCLLITGDKQGAIFGGLLDGPLKPTSQRKYQGTTQCFVFTTIYGEPRLFKPTGMNRYFYLCLNDMVAFGGGANFALCLNEDLLSGTSGPCETFGNACLAHDHEFELKDVELWGFTHASHYL